MKKTHVRYFLTLLSLILIAASCHKQLKPATVLVTDPVRHYYPVIQGDMMEIRFQMENTSKNPLFIQEIQTTCGCIIPQGELPIVVLPEKTGYINLVFNTIKNTGYVKHVVYCYGNFADSTCIELNFDTNVVPMADYIRDYEQLWYEQNAKNVHPADAEDGQKGYYTD
jgi:hypothetical protein